jgi:hypothetical protein
VGAGRALRLIADLDQLFESVVQGPDEWDEHRFAEWVTERLDDGEPLGKEPSRLLQQGVRRAQRLQRYWADRPHPPDWRMGVDEALGSAGWRVGLDLARWGLLEDPDPALYAEYARLFQAVKFQPPTETLADFEGRAR